jgi:hypothetical protein
MLRNLLSNRPCVLHLPLAAAVSTRKSRMAKTAAFIPQVQADRYGQLLQDKVEGVKTLFSDFPNLPELQVRG